MFHFLICILVAFSHFGFILSEDVITSRDGGNLDETVRLPDAISPHHYDLTIRPILNLELNDPDQFTAPGIVDIRVTCLSSTPNITLHAEDMVIDYASVSVKKALDSELLPIAGHFNFSATAKYTIQLQDALTAGEDYIVHIPFTAKVGDRLTGLYRSSYVNSQGVQRWLATTQFQIPGARLAFPCFDEPRFRATFNTTIGRVEGYHSLSNAALSHTIPHADLDGWFWDIFETTVSMPTYIVALIVSDFTSVTGPPGNPPYDIKIWGQETLISNSSAEFSSWAVGQILHFYESYFDYPYQFQKLDSVAIPDFWAGAMENWGCNTYRPIYLFWYEGESTQLEKLRVALTLSHEIIHNWYGNLLTCSWWNDIWLNEGFALYFQFLGANSALPNHGALDRYTIDMIHTALLNDAKSDSEPINTGVTDIVNNQPPGMVQKGCSLLRMMRSFLSEATFMKGMRLYIDQNAYSAVVQQKFFDAMQQAANEDNSLPSELSIAGIMNGWTLKAGYPLVKVSRAGANAISLSQERFVTGPAANITELWHIPIAYASKQNPDFTENNFKPKFWMDNSTVQLTKIIEDSTQEWIVVNQDAQSFYRVLYDDHFFRLIQAQLQESHTVLSVSTRCQLLDDHFKSAFAGYEELERALNLTHYLSMELALPVWTTVINNLRESKAFLQDTNYYSLFKDYVSSKISPALDSIGWEQQEEEDPPVTMLRPLLWDWACNMGVDQCAEVTALYIGQLSENNIQIPADLQPAVFCKAVSMRDAFPDFDVKEYLYQGYVNNERGERQTVFVTALGCESQEHLLELLNNITDPTSPFTLPHTIQILRKLGETPENRRVLLSYFQDNLSTIILRLGDDAVTAVATTISSYTSELNALAQARGFISTALQEVTTDSARRSLESSLTQLDSNVAWIQEYGSKYQAWLNSN